MYFAHACVKDHMESAMKSMLLMCNASEHCTQSTNPILMVILIKLIDLHNLPYKISGNQIDCRVRLVDR